MCPFYAAANIVGTTSFAELGFGDCSTIVESHPIIVLADRRFFGGNALAVSGVRPADYIAAKMLDASGIERAFVRGTCGKTVATDPNGKTPGIARFAILVGGTGKAKDRDAGFALAKFEFRTRMAIRTAAINEFMRTTLD